MSPLFLTSGFLVVLFSLCLSQPNTLASSVTLSRQLKMLKEFCSQLKNSIIRQMQNTGQTSEMDMASIEQSAEFQSQYKQQCKFVDCFSSYISSLAQTNITEIAPKDEALVNLQQCFERWLIADDIEHYKQLKRKLFVRIKRAIMSQMQNPTRKKRQAESWTCANVRLVSEAFTTVSDEEINNMNNTEFVECLGDIGSLTSWNAAQKTILLAKTEEAFGVTVCNLQTADLVNLGVIGEAMTTTQINCLPLDQDDVVASFGSYAAWSADQLGAFATRFMSVRSLSDLTGFASADVVLVGHLLCGFTTAQLADIPAATIATSGTQLGSLSHCPIPQLAQLKTLATDASAYGPLSGWTAAEVGELNFVLAGLEGAEIKDLSLAALEGLSSEVIPRIPPNSFKEINLSQLEVFTDVQAGSVTAEQRAVLSADQIAVLRDAETGGQAQQPEVTAPPSAGSMTDVRSIFFLFGSILIMLLVCI